MTQPVSQENNAESFQQAISRLAQLTPVEYDRVRKTEAKRLNTRIPTLDQEVAKRRGGTSATAPSIAPTVDPWPEPVDADKILSEISGLVRRYIVCDEDRAIAASLWLAMTWVVDYIQVCPLFVITAPEKRCGKSVLLDLLARLSRRPLVAANISPAAIYRAIEAESPTLLIDEADTFMRDNEQLRGIINSGHTRQQAFVIRTEGDKFTLKRFSTWSPKAIAGIGKLADTLMDRAIVIQLRRKLEHEQVDRLRYADPDVFARLSSMLARWAQDNGRRIQQTRPALPQELNDRAQDNWEPLFAIAHSVGGDWPALAVKAALRLSGMNEANSQTTNLLSDIRDVFLRQGVNRITTSDLLHELTIGEDAAWATYAQGKPLNARQLSACLSDYSIKPRAFRIGTDTLRGYERKDFEEAFIRYLAPSATQVTQDATPQQNSPLPSSDVSHDVADNQPCCSSIEPSETANSLEGQECCDTADEFPLEQQNSMENQ